MSETLYICPFPVFCNIVQKQSVKIEYIAQSITYTFPYDAKHCKNVQNNIVLYIFIDYATMKKRGDSMLQLNTVSLYQVLRDFNTLTNIRIVIFDSDFKEVLAYPKDREGFCALLRTDPTGEKACQNSDRDGCLKCAKSKELTVYRCHAGLTEVVVPIMNKSGVLAYVMFGQIIPQESCDTAKARIRKKYPAYSETIDKIPVKSSEELGAAATVLQAITSYVMTNRWVIPGNSEFIRQLDCYIEDRLSQTITVDEISAAFRIGRTRLYEISMEYLGCGLAEYIRIRRIHHAQRLLQETDTPITEIAYAVGFSDYNHFSRIFKKQTGISARAYRKG